MLSSSDKLRHILFVLEVEDYDDAIGEIHYLRDMEMVARKNDTKRVKINKLIRDVANNNTSLEGIRANTELAKELLNGKK